MARLTRFLSNSKVYLAQERYQCPLAWIFRESTTEYEIGLFRYRVSTERVSP